ncbi:hypothetical protein QVD17_07881 [Tagetes erecta]|uniref:Uncharacterized protein n=1 Tax=Tagetes erecta TaxID=13708 RepID=A0AAD8KYB5_TARER|nr:hypothetical protein QVD17_07881 [Tagetes erecta]
MRIGLVLKSALLRREAMEAAVKALQDLETELHAHALRTEFGWDEDLQFINIFSIHYNKLGFLNKLIIRTKELGRFEIQSLCFIGLKL